MLLMSSAALFVLLEPARERGDVIFGRLVANTADVPSRPLRPDQPQPLAVGSVAELEPSAPLTPPGGATTPPAETPAAAASPAPGAPSTAVIQDLQAAPLPVAPAKGISRLRHQARELAAAAEWQASLELYDRLAERFPRDSELALERARVVAWAGEPARAAAIMSETVLGPAAPPELQLERAQFLWWAGDAEAADRAVAEILRRHPARAEAVALRNLIRQSATPGVAVARGWLSENDAPLERVLLARALARSGEPSAAIRWYRGATEGAEFGDSLLLEWASIAATADSADATAEALGVYLLRNPADRAAEIRLARAYAWGGRAAEAIGIYTSLLDSRDDPVLRFERAEQLAWSGREAAAAAELERLIAAAASHGPALALLGDLARWDGDFARSLSLYSRAAEAGERIADQLALIGAPSPPRPLARAARRFDPLWHAEADAFDDSQRFRWLATRATRRWGTAARSLALTLHQEFSGSDESVGVPREARFGVEAGARLALDESTSAGAQLGVRTNGAGPLAGIWGVDIARVGEGSSLAAALLREPAARRVATYAAAADGTTSDLLQVTATAANEQWSGWSRIEAERLGSGLGATHRVGGNLTLRRGINDNISVSAGLSGLVTDGASPVDSLLGPLYWSPEWYVSPVAGVQAELRGERWRGAVRANPGYLWVRERRATDRRFASDAAWVAGFGADAGYHRDQWEIFLSADWNGALGPGYRAAALRAGVSLSPGTP